MMLMLFFCAGAALAVAACQAYGDARRTLAADWAKKEQNELIEEIKRLRAQVALHIGKE